MTKNPIFLIACLFCLVGLVHAENPIPDDVIVNIESLKPGEKFVTLWGRKAVWIIRRTPEEIQSLENGLNRLIKEIFDITINRNLPRRIEIF